MFQVVHVERVIGTQIQTKIDRPIQLDKQLIIEGSPHLYRLVAAIEHRSEHISSVSLFILSIKKKESTIHKSIGIIRKAAT